MVVYPHQDSSIVYVFPAQHIINKWCGVLHYLTGLENSRRDGRDSLFNFIMSNGSNSTQRDARVTYSTHMMPDGGANRIRSVDIHHFGYIWGFSFFDKDHSLIWKIGFTTDSKISVETVALAENEVIVGVVCKLYSGYHSMYTDF